MYAIILRIRQAGFRARIISIVIIDALPSPIWVVHPDQLNELANVLERSDIIGVDTESNSLFAYREQVCLIQISTQKEDYLVDALAITDLTVLGDLFSNPKIEKVFHAAEYDILCLKRDYHFLFHNIFDTMLAARILGKTAFGLGALLENEFDLQMDKKYQKANWGLRPLPSAMYDYARLDSHYLIPLRHRLEQELTQKRLMELAREDFIRMCSVESGPVDKQAGCWKIPGSRHLSPRQSAVLNELCQYREFTAQLTNMPVFKILGNDILLEVALACPENQSQLKKVQGVTQRVLNRHANGILQAVQKGLQAPPLIKPKTKRPQEDYVERLEKLKLLRKELAIDQKVESDVILPREILESIAENAPSTKKELGEVMYSVPYRYRKYGNKILKALKEVH